MYESPSDSKALVGKNLSNNFVARSFRKIKPPHIIVIILVIIVAIGGWIGVRQYKDRTTARCSDDILREASPLVRRVQPLADKLKPVVVKIKSIDGYDHDINCVYIVLNYYLYSSDATNAQAYLGTFNKLYHSNSDLSPLIYNSSLSPSKEALNKMVNAIEKNIQETHVSGKGK